MDTIVSVNKKINKESFPVTGMTCAACASSVESILTNTEGVAKASVNFASNSVLVEYDNALKEADCPDVNVRFNTMFTLEFLRPTYTAGAESVKTSVKASVKASVKTSVKLLELLSENPQMTLAEAAQIIGKSVRAIELASAKLVKQGKLKHVGPQKGGHWEVLE